MPPPRQRQNRATRLGRQGLGQPYPVPLIVVLMGFAALSMLLPAGHATILGQHKLAQAFFYAALTLGVLAGMIALATARPAGRPDMRLGAVAGGNGLGAIGLGDRGNQRGVILALIAGYAVLPAVFALPLLYWHSSIGAGDAIFDMLSAFTTTGAPALYHMPHDAPLPPSLTLWRAMVGWMGGLYFLVLASAVLMPMGMGGAEVVEGPDRGDDAPSQQPSQAKPQMGKPFRQGVQDMALMIFPLFGAVTLILWLGLTLAGEASFAALIMAMGVVSTSGIMGDGGAVVAQNSGLLGEAVIFAGLALALSQRMLPMAWLGGHSAGQLAALGRLRQDPELRLGLTIVLATAAALFVYHWIGRTPPSDATPLQAIWGGVGLALSYLTTTGYESHSTQMAMDWAGLQSPGLLLLGLAMVGGGVATTAGGVKLLRIHALMRHGVRELEKAVHPHSLGWAGQDARYLRRRGAQKAWVMFMLFALTIGAGAALLTLAGLGFDAALAFAISAITNTGPLATSLPDLPLGYGDLPNLSLAVLALLMVAGRLELIVLLAVLAPSFWRF